MKVKELISIFKDEWLPVDNLQKLDKNTEVTRDILSGDDLLAYDSMPLWKFRGLGPKTAMKLWKAGVRPGNIERHLKLLPESTRLFLKYKPVDKIPNKMVEEIYEKFIPKDEKKYCMLVGSYRRGKPTSGDIDILYFGDLDKLLDKLEKNLGDKWILVSRGPSKIAGIFVNKKTVEIDLWVCNPENKAAMMLYSTGSKTNNIRMRHIAKYRGMKLNQYGLFKDDKLIPTKTEKDIFDKLEMKYLEPSER